MIRTFQKARFFLLHPEVNPGKVKRLEALHREYVSYVRICVQTMIDLRRLSLRKSEMQAFFPKAENLTSQIQKNARNHAIQIVSGWAKARYALKIKKAITEAKRAGEITSEQAKALYIIGKYLRDQPKGQITQDDIDLYWKILDEQGGRKPQIRDSLPMRLSEMTSRLEDPKETLLADIWLRVSSLEARKSIWLPLKGSPYVRKAQQVSKGILARRTVKGTWRFETVEKREWVVPEPKDLPPDAPRLGMDVGLNVLAATSNGDLHGRDFKPKFDKVCRKVRDLRSNRMRQGLRENSPKLAHLESKLSGMIKTEVGRIANALVKRHPDTVFVLEDLDLRGCRGQKRFAYRALSRAMFAKAPVEVVNPAYTSQECPSCGYVSRSNRSGISFSCRSCGRKAHADWVGASGILRRSEDNGITCADHSRTVKATLHQRHLAWVQAGCGYVGSRSDRPFEPLPLGRSLTTRVPAKAGTGIDSNLGPPGSL